MTQSSSQISLYVDALIIEAIIANPSILKEAGASDVINSTLGKVKEYFASQIDPNNKAEDVMNLLAPGVISTVFSLFGKTWIGLLFGLAQQVFKINIGGIIMSLYEFVKSLVTGDKQTTSQQISSEVESAVKSNTSQVSEEDAEKAIEALRQKKSSADYHNVKKRLRDARVVKLAMVDYIENKKDFNKFAAVGLQSKIIGILITFFGFIFKVALGSAGLIVAGDAIHSFIGKAPTGILGSFTAPTNTPTVQTVTSKQTKFKPRQSSGIQYNKGESTWLEGFTNNTNGISEMLVQFAKEVYDGLNGLEDVIKSTETFQGVVRSIESFNRSAAGASVVFIPRGYTTKKQIVDLFIDDVAEKAPKPTA